MRVSITLEDAPRPRYARVGDVFVLLPNPEPEKPKPPHAGVQVGRQAVLPWGRPCR